LQLRGENLPFREQRRRSNPWRMLLYLALIIGGLYLLQQIENKQVRPLFSPTPIPTRVAFSYAEEARTRFAAGDLHGAVLAYQQATQLDPGDALLWAEMARAQTYSSALDNAADARRATLAQAREWIDQAVAIDPDNSYVHAIRALAYDWSASAEEFGSAQREEYLNEAESAATRSLQLDSESILARAFYAEVLLDQQKYGLARDYVLDAVLQAEVRNAPSMDVYRVYGTFLESVREYALAINEYEKARLQAPKFPFLYLQIGVNYRQLAIDSDPIAREKYIAQALDYFDMAARINDENGILDPTPYLAIGKTYLQQGEFFVAARNILKALTISPSDPDIFGRLGVVYHKARNYESAISVFSCAVDGCSAQTSEALICELYYGQDPPCLEEEVQIADVRPLPLDSESLVYYYTYGSVLAFYAGTDEYPQACQEAERIFRTLERSRFGSDEIVMDIIAEGRVILGARCGASPASQETSTPSALPTASP
jgi:tetratricopeptide (TPR) repeat protein